MSDETTTPAAASAAYKDDDLVYVDPDTKTVIGMVEWSRNGNPKSRLAAPRPVEEAKEGTRRRGGGRKLYPWGTYRSMKRVYQLEGKIRKVEASKTLDEILPKALEQAFWE